MGGQRGWGPAQGQKPVPAANHYSSSTTCHPPNAKANGDNATPTPSIRCEKLTGAITRCARDCVFGGRGWQVWQGWQLEGVLSQPTAGDLRQSRTDDTTTASCSKENALDLEISVAICSSATPPASPRKCSRVVVRGEGDNRAVEDDPTRASGEGLAAAATAPAPAPPPSTSAAGASLLCRQARRCRCGAGAVQVRCRHTNHWTCKADILGQVHRQVRG
jgi:hypothetical protein